MKLKKIHILLLVPMAYICTNSFAADENPFAESQEFEKEAAELKQLHALLSSTVKESDSFFKELDQWVDLQDKHQWPFHKQHQEKRAVQIAENAQKEINKSNSLMVQHKKRFFLNRDAFKHAALVWANRATHSNTTGSPSSFSSTSSTSAAGSSASSSSATPPASTHALSTLSSSSAAAAAASK